jgi:predicted O-methyltransferase YrrM
MPLRGHQESFRENIAARAVDALNKRIRNDPSVENVLLPVRDGIMLVRKLS